MDACVNHPDNAAIEHCEVCDKPLCGHCLWYTEDGHRLCENHAQEAETNDGAVITPPSAYAEAIGGSLRKVEDVRDDRANDPGVYKGNQTDLSGLMAALSGVATLLLCSGIGAYCLPFLALGVGIYAYSNAEIALDTDRTRKMALVGIGAGALMGLLIVSVLLLYFFMFMFIIFASGTP